MAAAQSDRITRQTSRVEYVPLDKMRVRQGVSQREFREAWADHIFKNFSLEKMRMPVVNKVGEWYWIMDGQHTSHALKRWIGDWNGQQIECQVFRNLSEQQEADLFLSLNDTKNVGAYDKYISALTAGHSDETNTDAIVRLKGLKIGRNRAEGSISCVTTLLKVYRLGADCLARDLEIVSKAFGDAGLEADVIGGIGLMVSRYDGRIDDKRAVRTLGAMRGSVSGLRARAATLHEQFAKPLSVCIAAAAVEAYNREKGRKKLESWWKTDA